MSRDQIEILVILAATVVMFLWGRWRHDLVAMEQREQKRAGQKLKSLATTLAPRLRGAAGVRRGAAGDLLALVAREQKSDVIVMTTPGNTGLKRVWLGSTAGQVLRSGPCPVLAIPRATPAPRGGRAAARIRNILVPLDLAAPSKTALRHAAALARGLKAGLTLLHVVPTELAPGRRPLEASRRALRLQQGAPAELEKLAARAASGLKRATIRVAVGEPASRIVEAARRAAADLIVIATHGRRGLKRRLLGSTAERVLRDAPVPVLAVREQPRPARKRRRPSLIILPGAMFP